MPGGSSPARRAVLLLCLAILPTACSTPGPAAAKPSRARPAGSKPALDSTRFPGTSASGQTAARPDYMAYVASTNTNQVIPVDLANGVAGRPIHVGPGPMYLAITPNGRTAYVAESGWTSHPVDSYDITPVELPSGRVLPPIRTGLGPFDVALTPNAKMAYVANMGSLTGPSLLDMHDATTVTPIDLSDRKPLAPIEVGPGPGWIAITPNGAEGVVVLAGTIQHPAHSLVPIDLRTGKTGRPIHVGVAPQGVAITPDGRWALASITGWPPSQGSSSSGVQDTVVPVNLRTGRAGNPIIVGPMPLPIVVSPTGQWAYVGITGGIIPQYAGQFFITPIDLADFHAGTRIRLPGAPLGLAITPRGNWLCAAVQTKKGDGLVVVNLRDGSVGPLIRAGEEVDGVAIDPVALRAPPNPRGEPRSLPARR